MYWETSRDYTTDTPRRSNVVRSMEVFGGAVSTNQICVLPYTRPEIDKELPKYLRSQDVVTMHHNEVRSALHSQPNPKP